MRYLLLLSGLTGLCSAQVPEMLSSRPAPECHLLAAWPAGGLVAAGGSTVMLVDPLPELTPTTGAWWQADTDILDLQATSSTAIVALGVNGLRTWNTNTPLTSPLVTNLPCDRLALDDHRGIAARGTQLTLLDLAPQGPQVLSGTTLGQPATALVLRDTLLYTSVGDWVQVHSSAGDQLQFRQQVFSGVPATVARLAGDELLLVRTDGSLQRFHLDLEGLPGSSEIWIAPQDPNDVLALGDEHYVVSIPGYGLTPVHWPVQQDAVPGPPRRFSDWSGSLLPRPDGRFACAEAALGGGLYLTDSDGVPQALGRFSTRPAPVRLLPDTDLPGHAWLLDGVLGWRRFGTETLEERMQVAFPRPVMGGDISGGWAGAVTANAGLRFYELFADSAQIHGIHSTDPVVDLAIGGDLMLAYITAGGFVAIKQINPFPYTLFHHGTINLSCVPGAAFWVWDQFFLGSQDGRLFHVDVSDPLHPVLVETLQLAGPVRDIDVYPPAALDRILVAAGDLYRIDLQGGGPVMIIDTWHDPRGPVACAAVNDLVCYATSGTPVIGSFPATRNAPLGDWGEPVILPAPALTDLEALGNLEVLGVTTTGELNRYSFEELDTPRPATLPDALDLRAHPNPANPGTRLTFHLPAAGLTTVRLFNLLGQPCRQLDLGALDAGEHTLPLDLSGLASGVYFCEVEAGERREITKVSVLK